MQSALLMHSTVNKPAAMMNGAGGGTFSDAPTFRPFGVFLVYSVA